MRPGVLASATTSASLTRSLGSHSVEGTVDVTEERKEGL